MPWSFQLLRAGSFRLDGGSMFGVVPKAIWKKLVEPDKANRIPLQTNCLLLEDGVRKVLVETGFGGKWTDKERSIYALQKRTIVDALAEIGVAPGDVSLVIVTHLHFDHAGGLTHLENDRPVSTFPNAAIVVQRTEWTDALENKSTMTKTYLRSHLDPIADQVRLADGTSYVHPGLIAWPVPGHTWGHQAVRFDTVDGVVCFPGDVIPTINHAGAAFNMGYDMLPHRNMLSKTTLLRQAAREGWRLVLDHEPGSAVVRVETDPAAPHRFALAPVSSLV